MICDNCSNGEYHGFKPNRVATIYFWCPFKKHHDCMKDASDCINFIEGKPKCIDAWGKLIDSNFQSISKIEQVYDD